MLLAAIPLAAAWDAGLRAMETSKSRMVVLCQGAAGLLIIITVIGMRDYFWTARKHQFTRDIYASEMTTASTYINTLPDDAYVLLYTWRWPFNIEIRQFLAHDAEGEDRSVEYGDRGWDITIDDHTRPTVFILMDDYVDLLPEIEGLYPGGVERTFIRDNKLEFVAYEVPPLADGGASEDEPGGP
jgi:hypothetical protein